MFRKVRLHMVEMRGFTAVAGVVLSIVATNVVRSESRRGIDSAVHELVTVHCLDCHQGANAEASVDLAAMLESIGEVSADQVIPVDLMDDWLRVEKVVATRRMPPTDQDSISADGLVVFGEWVHARLILRDGSPHIGPTKLRRLTHEEFIASLEDLLGIEMRDGYNHLQSVHVEKGLVDRVLPVEVPGKSGFVNDASAQSDQPVPLIGYMKCIDFALAKMAGSSESIELLTGVAELPVTITQRRIREIAEQFLRRALRGNESPTHLEYALTSYAKAAKEKSSIVALKSMLRTILLFPEFHYRLEAVKNETAPYPVSDSEFATRLSYFLTGSTPDDELLETAASGKLRDPSMLDVQVTRLMSTSRRLSLSESFAGQWIGFDALLGKEEPGNGGVPTSVRAQYDELLYFFDELFKSDRSLLDLIDSDWMYVSNYTLNSYGKDQFTHSPQIKPLHANVLNDRALTGNARRGIERIYDPPTLRGVQSDRYGGVITSAGVMSLTSAPQRTSPVRRGVWILDRLLGQSLEAPANVPPIEDAIRSLPAKNPGKLDIIKAHTAMPGCIVCHKDIDPIGFGLENFDSTGKWRTIYRDKTPVASEGVLPSGKKFTSPKELKQVLLRDYRELVVRNFIRRMMAYAFGRELRPYDRLTEDTIYQHVVKHGYRSNSVIRAIIDSPQFNCRQDEGS
ncbi:DUF1592 domain-containing protein [bacterium]|nr:DUF1592 domain-containing protein [bacterium]